jgi:hypothetical protein
MNNEDMVELEIPPPAEHVAVDSMEDMVGD